jgi:uncharacterized membrane protein YphA (DoxX/SURF4 family)
MSQSATQVWVARANRVAQVAIGLLFLWAALAKLGSIGGFAAQLHNYRMLPLALENLVALMVPWIEFVAGLALVLGVRPRAGAVVALGMMAVFTVAVAVAWGRGLNIECGCFGAAGASKVGARKLAENLGLTALAALASFGSRGRGPAAAD